MEGGKKSDEGREREGGGGKEQGGTDLHSAFRPNKERFKLKPNSGIHHPQRVIMVLQEDC